MDLRVVVHRGITLAAAMMISLVPVLLLLVLFWPTLSDRFDTNELIVLLVAVTVVSLLVPPTRDFMGRLLDKYVYRSQANFRKTIRAASQRLTRVLHLDVLLSTVGRTIRTSSEPEGVAIYLAGGARFAKAFAEWPETGSSFVAPDAAPPAVVQRLTDLRDLLVTDELVGEPTDDTRRLHEDLVRLNWALILPLVSEDALIGLVVVGAKRSGDPFYPHDLDLLMTLANQAGIAFKNAQLYTEVVLANEYVQNIVSTIESGVVAIDAGGEIMMFNRAAEELTGIPAAQVRGRPFEVLPEALVGLLRATVVTGEARREPELQLSDGTRTRPVMCTTSPLSEPTGVVRGAVAVFSDLTPIKELENERRRAERLAYFETLASSLAHEIKNPLVAVKTFTQLVPRRRTDERFLDDFNRIVTREIGRIERLAERLRTLSSPVAHPRRPLDLRAPIHDVLESLQPGFEEKRIAVRTDLGADPRQVLGDHGELVQLFFNLLMNGQEATPPDGTLAVTITALADGMVVTIADSGPGIPPEHLEHIFDPFFTTKQRGSGLGLTISAGIAAAHHAKLRAANRPEGGAVFAVEFPQAAAVLGAPIRS